MNQLMGQLSFAGAGFLVLAFIVAGYALTLWQEARDPEAETTDSQVGLKFVICGLALYGLGLAVAGAVDVIHYLLSGTKIGTPILRSGAAGLIAGCAVLYVTMKMLLPRTNIESFPRVSHLAMGFVSTIAGLAAVGFLAAFVQQNIASSTWAWNAVSGSMAGFIAYGAVGYYALNRLGAMSGWTIRVRPPKPAKAAPNYPGINSPYPQESGSYPQPGAYPQSGAYPPQQHSYPPQNNPYPPQSAASPQSGYMPQQHGSHQPHQPRQHVPSPYQSQSQNTIPVGGATLSGVPTQNYVTQQGSGPQQAPNPLGGNDPRKIGNPGGKP